MGWWVGREPSDHLPGPDTPPRVARVTHTEVFIQRRSYERYTGRERVRKKKKDLATGRRNSMRSDSELAKVKRHVTRDCNGGWWIYIVRWECARFLTIEGIQQPATTPIKGLARGTW